MGQHPLHPSGHRKSSETGIAGREVEDLVQDLVDKVDGNTTMASMGTVYVDEMDKVRGGVGPWGGHTDQRW